MVYEIQVNNNSVTTSDSYTGDWWNPTTTPTYPQYTYWYNYSPTIYMYQIKCPKCQTMNWAQLDTIKICTGNKCVAKLKAVSNQADYEIPVTT